MPVDDPAAPELPIETDTRFWAAVRAAGELFALPAEQTDPDTFARRFLAQHGAAVPSATREPVVTVGKPPDSTGADPRFARHALAAAIAWQLHGLLHDEGVTVVRNLVAAVRQRLWGPAPLARPLHRVFLQCIAELLRSRIRDRALAYQPQDLHELVNDVSSGPYAGGERHAALARDALWQRYQATDPLLAEIVALRYFTNSAVAEIAAVLELPAQEVGESLIFAQGILAVTAPGIDDGGGGGP